MLRRKGKQKLRDHLYRLAFCLGDAAWVLGKLLDTFPFQIAARVVDIRTPLAVGQDRHAAGSQHLHHKRSPRAGKAGNNCDHESFREISILNGETLAAFMSWHGNGWCSMRPPPAWPGPE